MCKNEGSRSKKGFTPPRRRRLPFTSDGTGTSRTGRRNRESYIPDTFLSCISECNSRSIYRSGSYKGKPSEATHLSSTMDPEHQEYGFRRSITFHRNRPGKGSSRTDSQNIAGWHYIGRTSMMSFFFLLFFIRFSAFFIKFV